MQTAPPCYGIIPARYASSRFPGKPLAEIMGKPMFWHVWSRAVSCPELNEVCLATDDGRIADAAKSLGVPYVMTSPDHHSGTDRVYEAATLLQLPPDSVVINIQGDEPLLSPAMLSALARPFADPDVRVATVARPISAAEAAGPDQVKVVMAKNSDALYFSRSVIPFDRDGEGRSVFGHVGLYAFRLEALAAFTGLEPSSLEKTEKLEQLRLLENNIPIRVVISNDRSIGVDRPEDLEAVLKALGA